MRKEQFLALDRGDVVTHVSAQSKMGLVLSVRDDVSVAFSEFGSSRHVLVAWEDGDRDEYATRDAPNLWRW